MGAENSGNLDAAIDSAQAQIEQQKADSTNTAEYHAAFFNQVDEFQKYDEANPLSTAEEINYFVQGKEQVRNLLLRVAASGKEIVDSREKAEGGNGNASAPKEKEKSKKDLESHENFYSLEQELKGILDQYRQNLAAMAQIEKELQKAKESDLKIHNLELTRAERLRFSIDGKDPDLQESIEGSLGCYEAAIKAMKNNSGIPANYKTSRESLLQQAIKPLLKKQTQIKLQEAKGNRDEIAYRVVEDFEAATCLKPMENFWEGKHLLEKGQTKEASATLTSFISQDLQTFKDYPALKGQENKYKKMAEELLKASDKALEENGNLEKDLEKQNEKFFKGQQLLQSGQIIEAKTSFKEYLKEREGKPENAGHPNFKDSAKAYLWKIAKIQWTQAKEKFDEYKLPEDPVARANAQAYSGKDYTKYEFYKQKIQEVGTLIDQEGLDFDLACQKVLGADSKYDPKNEFNFLAEELLLDKETPEEKKEGLLTLAKKYRDLGKTALAEQYYREYFSSQLNNLAQTTVSITSLRQKYGSPKYYPKIQPAVDQKLAQMEAAYNIRAKQDPAWAANHPFDSLKIRGVILDEALRKIMPNEVCEEQQKLFAADKNTFSNPKDQQAWSEFANMKGIHGQGKEWEMVAMSDDEWRNLIQELPIDIAFMAISGGVGGVAEKAVSEAVLKHGLTEVGLELAEMGVASGGKLAEIGIASGERKLAAYSAGLLANNTLFTGSNVLLNAIRKGEFKNMDETFKQEWFSGLAILGGLGQVGKLSHALHLGAISATTLELVGMGIPQGQLTAHDLGIVLGLKIAHAGQGEHKDPETAKAEKQAQKEGKQAWKQAESEYREAKTGKMPFEYHFNSEFADSSTAPEKIPVGYRTAPQEHPGWIGTDGKIYYNSGYFEREFGVKLGHNTEGQKVYIFEEGGNTIEITTKEFFRKNTDGKYQYPVAEKVISKMEEVKNHETTHRQLNAANIASKGKLQADLTELFSTNPELKAEFEKQNKRTTNGPLTEDQIYDQIEEFFSKIADGSIKDLSPESRAMLERTTSKYIKDFSFNRMRSQDAKRLRKMKPEELKREKAAAMTEKENKLTPEQEQRLKEDIAKLDEMTLKAADMLNFFDQLIDQDQFNKENLGNLRSVAEKKGWSEQELKMLDKSIKRLIEAMEEAKKYSHNQDDFLKGLGLDRANFESIRVSTHDNLPGIVEIKLKSHADLNKFRKQFSGKMADIFGGILGDQREAGWFAAQYMNPKWLGLKDSRLIGVVVTIEDAIQTENASERQKIEKSNLRHEYGHATIEGLIRPVLHHYFAGIKPGASSSELRSAIEKMSPETQQILFDAYGDISYSGETRGSKPFQLLQKQAALRDEQNLLDELRAYSFNLGLRKPTQQMTALEFISDPEMENINSIDPKMAQRFFEVHFLRVKAGVMSPLKKAEALSIIGTAQSLSQAKRLLEKATESWNFNTKDALDHTLRGLGDIIKYKNHFLDYKIGEEVYLSPEDALTKIKPPKEVIDKAIRDYYGEKPPADFIETYKSLYGEYDNRSPAAMTDTVPPHTESTSEHEGAVASSLESKRRIATETGKFYNSLLDTYLEVKTPEARQAQTRKLIESLPGPMKKLYGKGLERFQEELGENHKLLEQHQGDEVRYLLSRVMAADGKNVEEMEQVLQQADKAKFIEPSPGVAIIQVEKDFFRLLQEHGIVHAGGHAVFFGSDNRGEPSFLIVQRMSLEKSLAEDNSQAMGKSSVRHEFHHFIWNFLQRQGDYLREVSESSPELTKAFRNFRDEVAAYTIEGRSIGEIEPELLTYTEDGGILKLARDAQSFATICVEVAKQKGVDPQNFLYASMSSRNFAELKDSFAAIAHLDKIDQAGVAALYSAWRDNFSARPKVAELLERKKITIPTNLVEEYGLSQMISADITSMRDIFSVLENIKRFAGAVKLDSIGEQAMVEKAAQAKLPLPKKTVEAILALPREQSQKIPLGKSGEELLKSFVSFDNIDQEPARTAYKQVIDSSPVMREAFNKVREGIISKGTEIYRREHKSSNEEEKQKIESKIQERTRLLKEL